MTKDELIEYLENNTGDYIFVNNEIDKACRIALATLKAHKQGLLHCGELRENINIQLGGYDSDNDNCDIISLIHTELDEILGELE